MFYFDKVAGKLVLKSDLLSGVNHFFTTRELILKTKEEAEKNNEKLNREIIKKEFNLKYLTTPSQTHSVNIKVFEPDGDYSETDALILDRDDSGIFLNFADCTPVILYDSKLHIISVIHAGWRGTAGMIVKKTFEKIKNLYGSNPDDLMALIGPCICFDCFETSDEVVGKLKETVLNFSGCSKIINGKQHADLKEINKRQLNECGVKKVDIAPFCTCCDNDKFFSYRKENKTTNRMSAFVRL